MAKEKNERLSVTLQAKADFSQLINSLNRAYDEIKSKADKSDLFSIDKTLKQMNELQIKLQQSMEQGFSSPKELSQFQKIMNTLNKDAGDLTAKFQSIHIRGLQDELKEASKALKDIQTAYQKVQKEVERTIAAQMQGVQNNQEYAKRIAETQGDTKKLQQIEDSITNEINEQIQAQQRLREAKEETLEAEKKSLRSSENTKSNITTQTFLRAKDFKRADGKQFEQSDWNAIKEGFKNITNSAKNSTSALNSFNRMLKTLGYEAENPETVAKRFMSLGHIFDKDGPLNKGIEESKNNIKNLEEEISDISEQENKLANDKNIVSTAIHSNETAEELGKYAEKTNEVTTAIQRKNKAEQESQNTNLTESIREANELLGEQKQNTEEVIDETSKIQESKQNFDDFTNSLQNSVKQILSITTSWRLFRQIVSQTFEDVKELDKSFAQIAMVTNYEVSDMWDRYSEYAQLANKLGQSTQSVIEASGLYYQQGLDTAEVMALTEETMKLATLAGLDFSEATSQMTAAIRGFHMEMSEGQRVTDVYAEVAAHAAVNVQGLSDAMSATASIANSAGMQFETTTAMLATMAEATQEAPKNLGTALKTVIARFTELKENVAGTADSEFDDLDYNKVDKALKTVGVQLKDTTGQFRNLDDVFLELGKKWNTLDRNSQRYIATIAAGSRQQSRFIALMENYERTMQLVDVAQNSAGKSQKQFAKFSDSTEYKLNKLKNTFEQVRISLTGKGVFDTLIEGATEFAERLQGIDLEKILLMAPIALTLGRTMAKQWINGLSEGLQNGKGLINKAIDKALSKKGRTKAQIELDISQAKNKIQELENDKKRLDILLRESPNFGLVTQLQQAENKIDELTTKINALPADYDRSDPEIQQWQNELAAARREAERLADALLKADPNAYQNYQARKTTLGNIDKENANVKALTKTSNSILKQAASGVGSALGEGMATAAMMAFTGTFDWSEIFTTTTVQSGISAFTTLLTGNWQMALGQAAVGLASFAAKEITEYFEKQAEIERENADKAYKIAKQIEVEKEEQEKLNEKLDEANQKYDKANEEHQEFQKAVDTYEELSKKILLTEEEQEELNNATQTLIDLHPELVTGYDSAGNAILKMGSAWDEVIKKEKESFQLIQEIQNQAEISAFAQNYKVATEELEHANEILKAVQNLPETENTIRDYGGGVSGALTGFRAYTDAALSFNPALGLIFNTAGGPKPEDYEVGLQNILTDTDEDIDHKIDNLKEWREKNRKYDDLFLLAINEITNENYTNIDNAFKELNKADNLDSFTKKLNEYLEAPEKAAEDAQRKVESLDLVKKATLDEFKKSANNSIKNLLDTKHDLSDFSEQQNNILEQLINIALLKDDDKIEKAMTADDGGWSYFGELASSENAQQIIEQLKKVSPAAQEAISDYYKDLYTRSQEENTKILHQIVSDYHLGKEIERALTESFSEAASSWGKSYNKIAEAFGAGFENSQLSQILQNSGAEGAKAFENSFAQFDTNEAARIFITNLSKNLEKYSGEIPNEAISYLVTYDWSTVEITDLANIKQGFLDYCDTIEGGIDNAEQLWEDYKNYLLQYNVLQTPTLLTIEDLEEQISTSLKDKVEASSGLATAVEKQLENGVLNFSESQSFKEACEKIGLTASDYLSYGLDGTITLDTEALKEGIEAQKLSEAEVLEEVKNQLIAKRDQLETELAIFDAAGSILTEEETRRDLAISIADAYWDAAQAMAAMNPDKVKLGNRQTIRFQDVTGADVSAQRAELEKQIEQLNDTINHLSPDSAEYKAFLSEYEAAYTEILKSITDKEEAATKQAEENAKAAADAYEAWEKQVEAVNEKIKELNETIRGSEYFDSGIDSMYNYTTALERVTKAADDARDTLKDLQDTDNASESMDKYLNAIHNEAAISEAEARVYAQAITNGQKVINEKLSKEIEKLNAAAQARAAKTGETVPLMSTDTSGLYSLVGDRYQINLEKVNNLPMNDEIKKMIAEELKSWNDNLDKIEELEKKRSDRIKEYQQLQKDALSKVVNLEEEMKNTLKEKYEQEITDVENKYKAMEEADNNYVDALEEAIKRQRELRERENQWNDLNEKERKLSLMQRDTSGGNRVETRQLEKEVQNDRQQLLDNSVDDIINGLKDMYELQKESREAEIEYRKALIDEGMLMREVTAALANIDTADDLVAWFYQNTANLSEMSEEQIKLEEMNWRDMFDAKTSYMEISQADFEEALLITEADIAQVVNETSETLTVKADQTLNQVIDSVDNAIEKMQTDLEQARKDLQEKWQAYLDALAKTAQQGTTVAKKEQDTKDLITNTALKGLQAAQNYTRYSALKDSVVTNVKEIKGYNPVEHYKSRSLSGVTDASGTINGGWTKTVSPTINGGWTTKTITKAMKNIIENEDLDKYLKLSTDEKNVIKNNLNTLDEDQLEHFLNMRSKYDHEVLLGKREKSNLFGFAKGGLVNYTGPAWVDGTKRSPEAFLSAEDTKRIGEAAKILSQIPELNSTTFDKNNITTTTVGDTTININLTIENVSSDYDVDQAVERVKQDIVEAAKYRGSNVILNKHI